MEMVAERDDPERVVDGLIDVGELVAQHLSLNLDPYPRADDAGDPVELQTGPVASPFAALASLKDKLAHK